MKLQNRSEHEWLDYNCGHCKVDILPKSTFEVDDKTGAYLLKILGAPNWLVPVSENTPIIEEELTDSVCTGVIEDKVEIKLQEEKRFCDSCDSKGVRHKKMCPKNTRK